MGRAGAPVRPVNSFRHHPVRRRRQRRIGNPSPPAVLAMEASASLALAG